MSATTHRVIYADQASIDHELVHIDHELVHDDSELRLMKLPPRS